MMTRTESSRRALNRTGLNRVETNRAEPRITFPTKPTSPCPVCDHRFQTTPWDRQCCSGPIHGTCGPRGYCPVTIGFWDAVISERRRASGPAANSGAWQCQTTVPTTSVPLTSVAAADIQGIFYAIGSGSDFFTWKGKLKKPG